MASSENTLGSVPAAPPHDELETINPGPFSWVEQVASRYFSIWIWSIVVGVSTSTSLSLTNYLVRSRGSFLNALIAPLFAVSALALLAGFWGTIRFFDSYILTLFVGDPSEFAGAPSKELVDRRAYERDRAGRYLRMAVRYSFMGLAFRLMLGLADILLSSLPY